MFQVILARRRDKVVNQREIKLSLPWVRSSSQYTGIRIVFRCIAFSFGHTGAMYFTSDALEFPSSPPSIRNGLPCTISCVAVPCFFMWGRAVALCGRTDAHTRGNPTGTMLIRHIWESSADIYFPECSCHRVLFRQDSIWAQEFPYRSKASDEGLLCPHAEFRSRLLEHPVPVAQQRGGVREEFKKNAARRK